MTKPTNSPLHQATEQAKKSLGILLREGGPQHKPRKPTASAIERALRLHQDDCVHTQSDALRDQIDKANCRDCLAAEIDAAVADALEAAAQHLEDREWFEAANLVRAAALVREGK